VATEPNSDTSPSAVKLHDRIGERIATLSMLLPDDFSLNESVLAKESPAELSAGDQQIVGAYAEALRWVIGLMAKAVKKTRPSVMMTGNQQACLQAGMDHDKTALAGKDMGRAVGSMLRRGLMSMHGAYPALTPEGEAIAAEYGIVKSEKFVPLPEGDATVALSKRVKWTPGQKEAFVVAMNGDRAKWNGMHGKTQRVMTDAKWVMVSSEGTPSGTPLGLALAAMNGLTISALAKASPAVQEATAQIVEREFGTEEDDGVGIGVEVGRIDPGPTVVF
jgi:hypothetical protein